jgi:predicted transcriptional regulator
MTTRQNRDRYEILADMLKTIIGSGIKGASKTIIMYNSFLSFAQLKEYLSFLLDKGLGKSIIKGKKTTISEE